MQHNQIQNKLAAANIILVMFVYIYVYVSAFIILLALFSTSKINWFSKLRATKRIIISTYICRNQIVGYSAPNLSKYSCNFLLHLFDVPGKLCQERNSVLCMSFVFV